MVSVVKTAQNESNITLNLTDGRCTGILYDYIDGTAVPNVKYDAEIISMNQCIVKLWVYTSTFIQDIVKYVY